MKMSKYPVINYFATLYHSENASLRRELIEAKRAARKREHELIKEIAILEQKLDLQQVKIEECKEKVETMANYFELFPIGTNAEEAV